MTPTMMLLLLVVEEMSIVPFQVRLFLKAGAFRYNTYTIGLRILGELN